jgi:hypothetical protein
MTKEYNWRTDYDWTDPNDHPVTTQNVKLTDVDLDSNVIPLTTLKKVKAFIDCDKSLKEAK